MRSGFGELLAWKERRGCFLVRTSPDAEADYREAEYHNPTVVLTEGERVGLTPEQQAACDLVVRIPMAGRCESHHVTIATGLVLYEILRQHRPCHGARFRL